MSIKRVFQGWAAGLLLALASGPVLAQNAPVALAVPNVTISGGGHVRTVARQPNGGIVFGGYFTSVNGVPRGHIARLHADGSLDMDWNPAANALVRTVTVDSSGAVYAGGSFEIIGGRARNLVAKLDGGGTGAADSNWNPAVLAGNGGGVNALLLDNTGALYITGGITSVAGVARNFIAKVSSTGTGALDASWFPRPFGQIDAMALDGAGSLYLGGAFDSVSGVTRNNLAKVSASGAGAVDSSWNPDANGYVKALAVDSTGAVYAGGAFTAVGGQLRSHIVKLAGNGPGAPDGNWNPGANNDVNAILVDGNAVYAGGAFHSVAGLTRDNLVKLARTGTGAPDPVWNPSLGGDVLSLASGGNGSIFLTGLFEHAGSLPRNSMAALPGEVVLWTLTYTAGANGTIVGASPQTVPAGTNGSPVTAQANPGYQFVQWSDGSTANPRTDTNVSGNLNVSASFAVATYTVRAFASLAGSITPAQRTVEQGQTATFTLQPQAGAIPSASGCGGSLSGNTYTTGPITANCDIQASFPLQTFTVTATAGPNGSITPASQTVSYGSPTAFIVTPASGYQANVSGCGGSLNGSIYTTAPITAACSVNASFGTVEPIFALTVEASREYVRNGQVLNYAVTLSNTGNAPANPASIALTLPPQLDASATNWICTNGGNGALCTVSGTGALLDVGVVLPPGRSLSWLVVAPVRANASGGDIVTSVAVSSGAATADASASVILVVMRNGFEPNGDGAQGNADEAGCTPIESSEAIDAGFVQPFNLPDAHRVFDTVLSVHANDGSGLRVERANLAAGAQLQLVSTHADRGESASGWSVVDAAASPAVNAGVDSGGLLQWNLVGTASPLRAAWSMPSSDVVRIRLPASREAGCR